MADNEKQPLNRHERLIDRLLDQHEKLITRLIESYETFTGERLSRGRANDLLSALEINGLDIKLNEE